MAERSEVVFDAGLDFFAAVANQLKADDWNHPSACEGWTALDVLGHLISSIGFGVAVLKGEEPTWPTVGRPAELVDGEPVAAWNATAAQARDALRGADLDLEMDTPMGKRTAAERLAFPAIDLYVHAWDIGHPAGVTVEIPAEVIQFTHTSIDPIPTEMMRGPKGAFGPEITPPPDATPTEAFVAWTGRDPR